jgi:hypothetical protein
LIGRKKGLFASVKAGKIIFTLTYKLSLKAPEARQILAGDCITGIVRARIRVLNGRRKIPAPIQGAINRRSVFR